MDYRTVIGKALDYIEENLKNEISISDLAKLNGYSEYHFLRIFRDSLGLTPADYIRKRRISEIVRRIGAESRPISDIAFEYGFNSRENFIRAFKKEHRILPTDFRTVGNSLRLYDRPSLNPEEFSAEAEIQELQPFAVIAYPCDEEYPPRFWNRYNAGHWSQKLSGGRNAEDYGVCRWNQTTDHLDYWIGIHEKDAEGDLSGTVRLEIAGGTYAVFRTPCAEQFDFVAVIHRTWEGIAETWLPGHGYVRTGGYEMESYIEESRTFSEKIYIPVRRIEI